LLAWTALVVAIHATPCRADDRTDIRGVMIGIFDKLGSSLIVEPVVVVDNSAVASWTQGDRGGRALLRREEGKWRIVLCSGDPLKSASMLEQAGVPPAAAERLETLLKQAESVLPPERVALFSTFEGVVNVDDNHGHGNDEHKHQARPH
jgi:hypothetical protein